RAGGRRRPALPASAPGDRLRGGEHRAVRGGEAARPGPRGHHGDRQDRGAGPPARRAAGQDGAAARRHGRPPAGGAQRRALPLGTIGVRTGPMNAASDGFVATIRGKGAHAARPHLAVDPVVIAAQCILALQTLVSREVNPLRQAVITVGAVHAGTVANIIPEEAVMRATVRTFDDEVRPHLAERIPALLRGIAAALRGEADVQYRFGYPVLVNDAAMTDLVREVARGIVGPEKLIE